MNELDFSISHPPLKNRFFLKSLQRSLLWFVFFNLFRENAVTTLLLQCG